MLRFFLITLLLLFVLYSLRRFLQGLYIKPSAEYKDRDSALFRKDGQKALDLVRDEETGEYRVKDD